MLSSKTGFPPAMLRGEAYQFDAVPKAAPLVRMDRLLISVGYNQGTP